MKKTVVTLMLLMSSICVQAQTFPGTGGGALPDGTGVPTTCGSPGAAVDVTFDVTGVTAPLTAVELDIDITHTWVNDIVATLIAPSGETHVLFGQTHALTADGCGTSIGGDADLGGVYNFTDAAMGVDWWTAAATAGAAANIPLGDYRTTEQGGDGQVNPAPATDITAAFAAVADPNGTWILRVTDGGVGDNGTVDAANLFLMGSGPSDIIFENGFEAIPVL